MFGSITITHLIVFHTLSWEALVRHIRSIVHEFLIRETSHTDQRVSTPLASIVNSCLIELVEVHAIATSSHTRTTFVGRNLFICPIVAIVTFFDCSETAHLQSLNCLDVNSSLDRTTEVVAILVALFLVHILNRVAKTSTLWREICTILIIDRICRVERSRHLEIAAEIVVAIVHVRHIVLEIQPAIECFLLSSNLSHYLLAVVVLSNTFSIFECHRSTIVEILVGARDCQVVVMSDSRSTGKLFHPIGFIRNAIYHSTFCILNVIIVYSRNNCAIGQFLHIDKLISSCHTCACIYPRSTYVTRVFNLSMRFVREALTTFGCDKNHTIGTTSTVDSRSRTVLKDVHRSDFLWSDIVDIVYRNTIHNIQRRGTCTFIQSRETTNLDAIAARSRV